jgi:uncharacterized protein (TIGR01777 family)
MRIAISGSTGFVGDALIAKLKEQGHEVIRLVRRPGETVDPEILWNPAEGTLNPEALEGIGGVINLSGENIASGRWTPEKKRRIRDSRVAATTLLSETIARLKQKPQVMVSASAIGYYGDRGDELLDESSAPGTGFLAEVCQHWESAAQPAEKAGIRVCLLRIGAVLDPAGGALGKMLAPFKMGMGGVVGRGDQYMSWITREDLVGAILHCLDTPGLAGPVNAMAPNPVTNREFTAALGKALGRPTLVPVPAFALKMLLGELGENLALVSTRAVPRQLEAAGFTFTHPDIDTALEALL